jgi:NAD+ kinase
VKTILVFMKPGSEEEIIPLLEPLYKYALENEGIKIHEVKNNRVDMRQFPIDRIHMAVVFGGDGTMIGATRALVEAGIEHIPSIIGVHLGTVGYKMTFSVDNYIDAVKNPHKMKTKKVDLLPVLINTRRERGDINHNMHYALNDVVVKNGDCARICKLSLCLDNQKVAEYRSDGLIISSTGGSTAYNLSAGGPIVSEDIKARIVTAICAISLSQRPIVISDKKMIRVNVVDENGSVFATIDGQMNVELKDGDSIEVLSEVHRRQITVLYPRGFDEHLHLKLKMGWK